MESKLENVGYALYSTKKGKVVAPSAFYKTKLVGFSNRKELDTFLEENPKYKVGKFVTCYKLVK